MKTLVSISIIVLIIIVGGLICFNAINAQADTMYTDLLALERNLQAQNWDKAFETYKSLNENWDEIKQRWPLVIDHFEIDSINMALAELNAYIKTKEDGESLAKVYSLKVLVKHIPEKESFTLKNIF